MDLIARLKISAQNFSSEFGKVLGDVERKSGSTGSVIGRNLSQGIGGGLQDAASRVPLLGGALAGLSGAALVTAAGLGAVGLALAHGIAEAEGYAKAVRQIDAVLKATGNNTGYAREELIAFANEMEGVWATPAEEIMKAEQVLASFDGVAGATFKRAIQGAADLSAVYGGDLSSNVEKVGTVLQNLAQGEVTGLSKGFKFLGVETVNAIGHLAEAGRTAEAQAALLRALEQQVGGAKAEDGKGLSGAFFRLGDAIGDAARNAAVSSGAYGSLTNYLNTLAGAAERASAGIAKIGPLKLGEDPQGLNRIPGLSLDSIIGRRSAERAYASAEEQRRKDRAAEDADKAAKKAASDNEREANKTAADLERSLASLREEYGSLATATWKYAEALTEIERLQKGGKIGGSEAARLRLNVQFAGMDALHTVQRRETVERIEGDTAIVTDMALIGAKSLDGSAWILDLSTVKVGPTETFGERLSEIDATFTTVEAAAEANHTELTTAIASEASARVTAISTLTASVGTLASNTAASIVTLQAADATEASARASAITSLTATVTTLSGTVTANYSSLVTAVSNETSARVSALSSLTSTVTTLSGTVSSNYSALNSAISSEASARASADTALTATIGGVSATVTTHSSAITSLTGRTTSYWEITTNAGSGATAFIAARAETSPGSVTSNVAFGAREVHISNPIGGAWTKVLSIVGGEVNVYGKLTATGAVTTPNIVANNVTQMESSLSASAVTSSGGWENILGSATWHTFELDHDAEVLMLFTGRLNYFGSTPSIVRMTLYNVSETYLGAIEGPSTGDGGVMPNPTFPWKIFLAAGIYHVAPQFLCDAGDAEMRSGSGVIVFWRYC